MFNPKLLKFWIIRYPWYVVCTNKQVLIEFTWIYQLNNYHFLFMCNYLVIIKLSFMNAILATIKTAKNNEKNQET